MARVEHVNIFLLVLIKDVKVDESCQTEKKRSQPEAPAFGASVQKNSKEKSAIRFREARITGSSKQEVSDGFS